jgi:hypothetical protein
MTTLLLLAALTLPANALMPPRVYAERSEQSKIKAIAVIVAVESDQATGKNKVTFRNEYSLTADFPATFTGFCFSAVTDKQKNMVGPTVYFHPHEGDRVFVTVTGDRGDITSMTPVTPELEKAVRNTPEKIRYGISKAYVE